jgi:hypothetical protein
LTVSQGRPRITYNSISATGQFFRFPGRPTGAQQIYISSDPITWSDPGLATGTLPGQFGFLAPSDIVRGRIRASQRFVDPGKNEHERNQPIEWVYPH